MLFADKIRQLKEEWKLLQRQLAAALDMGIPMFSKIGCNEHPAKRAQVAAKETLNNTKVQA